MVRTIERTHTVKVPFGSLVGTALGEVPAKSGGEHAMRGVVGTVHQFSHLLYIARS